MASGVKVKDFVAIERALVKDGLKWAPQTLTAAEREWVPAAARDNFDKAVQARGGSIDKETFVKVFTSYAALQAYRADAQDNGILSAEEAKSLPADLRDNFKDAVRVARGADWKQASAAQLTDAGRKALERYVKRVLFNPNNPEGEAFRSNVLDWRTPEQKEQYRQELLAEAAAWAPDANGWTTADWDTRTLVAEGDFGGLYSNLFFEKGRELPRVYVEID